MALFDLTGKGAVVIGGAGGLGQAIAQGLAQAGAKVLISSRKEDALKRAQDEIKAATGLSVEYATGDASVEADVIALVKTSVSKLGKVDILVNAQGFNKKQDALDFDLAVFAQMLTANVTSVMTTAKHFGAHMKANGYGKIVNLSSVRGKIATKTPGNAGYCATKGAVDMLTKQLASEFGPFGITVNAIGPNITETPMMSEIFKKRAADAGIPIEEYLKGQAADLPLRRMAQPDDCVGTVVFLAAPASDFMTGNILYPDGGLVAVG
ncbi:MAG: SDR family oxidoreductase [Oscillospiraceae bacterium]|jgi:gluconate 5-dehydrogenase|nr:SDR family oxidoreductase [Oscillospiraceae bacterium]